jgi:hypothetical protein
VRTGTNHAAQIVTRGVRFLIIVTIREDMVHGLCVRDIQASQLVGMIDQV